jgi:DNA-damage-inducible protein D
MDSTPTQPPASMDLTSSPFDRIRRVDPEGTEYWSSRDLAPALDYVDYRNFMEVIERAKVACTTSGYPLPDHFVDSTEMVQIGSGAQRPATATWMSRYACYLVAQNADATKLSVALAQTYFALQTRRQEVEDQRRLMLREEMKKHNNQLASAAHDAGVVEPKDYAIFTNKGYQGLYDGMTKADIHQRKRLKKSQQILDHMGSSELAANLFRATQTEEKLRRDKIKGKERANQTHFDVGKKVRKTIAELGGTMPEDLPVVDSVKKLEGNQTKQVPGQASDP